MFGFSFFGNRKPRQFDYRPRYYDPEKEEREERKKALLGEDAVGDENGEYRPGQYIGRMRHRRDVLAKRAAAERKQARLRRLIIFLVLAGFAAWWLLR